MVYVNNSPLETIFSLICPLYDQVKILLDLELDEKELVGKTVDIIALKMTTGCHCDIDPKKRTNCGPPGITPQQCRDAACCFDSKVPGVPWCFKPLKEVCPTEVKQRVNCGYPGIPAHECNAKGCCFEARPPGVPWCFYHILIEAGCLKLQLEMNFKWFWLWTIVLIVAFSSLADARIIPRPPRTRPRPGRSCNVPPQRRRDCGYPGISRQTCQRRGCCFSSRIAKSKWCFFRRLTCNVVPHRRRECGYKGITRETCQRRGCCFDNRIRGVKWCFHQECKWPAQTLKLWPRDQCQVKHENIAYGQCFFYPGQCDVQLKQRINCGYPYISAQECYNKGCCFDSSIAGTIWCFFPGSGDAQGQECLF
ncbi:putative gastrointestinal growth factor xP4 [Varanus komodoensis]|uniref:putative gastrointestinal growth factor xP4 n=1 Tax=Varanus komodoensis TaxID=61221 RepID=UPI001CF771E6|nr:putative gastrointestinal growth factor xP4 [Varanus komodoensis]